MEGTAVADVADLTTEVSCDAREDETDGGYSAAALGQDIFTDGNTLEELRANVGEAVQCNFCDRGPSPRPQQIRLNLKNAVETTDFLARLRRNRKRSGINAEIAEGRGERVGRALVARRCDTRSQPTGNGLFADGARRLGPEGNLAQKRRT